MGVQAAFKEEESRGKAPNGDKGMRHPEAEGYFIIKE